MKSFFEKMIDEAAEQEPLKEPAFLVEIIVCDMCHDHEDVNEHGICDDCQKAVDRGYQIQSLAGRCANGMERDRGILFHARQISEGEVSWKAYCGYHPKGRSGGWSSWKPDDRQVTCSRCLRKL